MDIGDRGRRSEDPRSRMQPFDKLRAGRLARNAGKARKGKAEGIRHKARMQDAEDRLQFRIADCGFWRA